MVAATGRCEGLMEKCTIFQVLSAILVHESVLLCGLDVRVMYIQISFLFIILIHIMLQVVCPLETLNNIPTNKLIYCCQT